MELSSAKRKIRKCRDMITAGSYGIVILVIWDFIKNAIYIKWAFPDNVEVLIHPVFILFIIFAIFELLLCVIFGLILIKFGRNNKNCTGGLIVASLIMLIISGWCLGMSVASLFNPETYSIVNFITLIEDIIFFIFAIQILYSLCKIIKLSKVLKEHENGV